MMPTYMATCIYDICDYFDLTGDPSYGFVDDGKGGQVWQAINDCDGQPNDC